MNALLIVRYQCVEYKNLVGEPIDLSIEFSNGPIHWICVGENRYLAFALQEREVSGVVDLKTIELLQDQIEYANDVLIVKNGIVGELETPEPIGVHILLSDDEKSEIDDSLVLEKPLGPDPIFPVSPCSLQEMLTAYVARERLQFLATAESRGLGKSSFLTYIRLFEAAFSLSGDKLKRRLTEFLSSGVCNYSTEEIRGWLTLRGKLAHGDRKRNWAREREAWGSLPRVRQAAFDVVFNKERWASSSTQRRDTAPIRFQIAEGMGLVLQKGYDGFRALPFHLDAPRLSLHSRRWASLAGVPIGEMPDRPLIDFLMQKHLSYTVMPFRVGSVKQEQAKHP